jgi:hypothetical protein
MPCISLSLKHKVLKIFAITLTYIGTVFNSLRLFEQKNTATGINFTAHVTIIYHYVNKKICATAINFTVH